MDVVATKRAWQRQTSSFGDSERKRYSQLLADTGRAEGQDHRGNRENRCSNAGEGDGGRGLSRSFLRGSQRVPPDWRGVPRMEIQNFRSFSFVWGIVCLNRCHRTVTRQNQKCFKTSGTPCISWKNQNPVPSPIRGGSRIFIGWGPPAQGRHIFPAAGTAFSRRAPSANTPMKGSNAPYKCLWCDGHSLQCLWWFGCLCSITDQSIGWFLNNTNTL